MSWLAPGWPLAGFGDCRPRPPAAPRDRAVIVGGKRMAARIATFVLGIWLLATGVAVGNLAHLAVPQWIAGAVIMAAEVCALKFGPFRWVSFLVGVWLVIQPFVLAVHSPLAAFNSYSVGLLVMVLAGQATHPASYLEPTSFDRDVLGRRT